MTKAKPPDWILTDMESVVPPAARGRVSRIDAWQIMEYETDSFSGTLALTRWPIDGFSMWDGILRSAGFDKTLTALHSPEGIRDLIAALRADRPVHHDLVMLDGVHSDKYSFGWNF